jgi:hypothetical protein
MVMQVYHKRRCKVNHSRFMILGIEVVDVGWFYQFSCI